MAISLGSLYVELKANTAQFLDGMTKAATNARATGRDIQSGLGKIGEMFAPLGEAGEKLAGILGVVGSSARGAIAEIGKSGVLVGGLAVVTGGAAALAGGFFALAEKASEVGAKIYEASEKTGISALQMSGLMAITKETGGNFDALTTSLARAGANLQKAIIDPGGATGKVLTQVMGGMKQLVAEGAKPMGDRLQDVLKHIFEMNNVGERNVALSALLGKGWMENVSVLKLLAEQGYAPAISAAQRLGIAFDATSSKQARDFQNAIVDLKGTYEGLGVSIGQKAIPELQAFVENCVFAIPYLKAYAEAIIAGGEAMVFHFAAAQKWADKSEATLKGVDQYETDYLTHLDALTRAAKTLAGAEGGLSGSTKTHADALANLISREQEQLAILNTNGNQVQQLKIEYNHTVDEIHKMVAAGGSFKEGLAAQGLALDIYHKKLLDLAAVFPKVGEAGWAQLIKQPAFAVPTTLPFTPAPPQVPGFEASTPAGIAAASREMDKTRQAEKALRLEADLSKASLEKLSAAFAGLTNSQIASSAAGQRMIEQLTKMDRFGSFADQFKETWDGLILDGENFAGNMVKIVGGAIDKIEDKFAEMIVKGRANFRELTRSIEEEMAKAAIKKGVSMGLSEIGKVFGGKIGGTKADGSAGSPFYVILANKVGQLIGGQTGQGIAKPVGALMKDAGIGGGASAPGQGAGGELSSLTSALGPMFSSLERGLGGIFKGIGGIFGGLFGGFLAGGGDVMPGRAYVVGEKRAELFVPHASGHVAPSVPAGRQTVVHVHQNITTPDADSFRRSQAQLADEAYRSMAMAHART